MRIVQRSAFAIFLLSMLLISGCNGFFTGGDSIASISISPASRLSATGQTINFTATGTTVNGATKDITSSAKWSSSVNSVATVSAGTVSTVATGTTTLTASQDSGSGTASLIVTATTLQSIAVSPTGPSVLQTQGTEQFTATGTFADGSTMDLTSLVGWTSSTTTVATINTSGAATLIAAGQTTITATVTTGSGVVTGSTTMTVQ